MSECELGPTYDAPERSLSNYVSTAVFSGVRTMSPDEARRQIDRLRRLLSAKPTTGE